MIEKWMPIKCALEVAGHEIIGSRWAGDRMIKEPFVSSWSPTMNKWYVDPTHWIAMPEAPASEG